MMQDDAGLVEVIAAAVKDAKRIGSTISYEEVARAALAAIEAAGWVCVPREVFGEAREFIKDTSEDMYTQGVPWRQAERLLKKIDAAIPPKPQSG
jgi:hypothetical protein